MTQLVKKFSEAVLSVNWNANIGTALTQEDDASAIVHCNLILAHWSNGLEKIYSGNAALPFIREMQLAGHNASTLTCLALYKPAATSMRTILETALYFSYFKDHPVELATLTRESSYFIQRTEILEFHKMHTHDYSAKEKAVSLHSRMNNWYKSISGIIHGQLPGGWTSHKGVNDIHHHLATLHEVVAKYKECIEIVNLLFLVTVSDDVWHSFSPTTKKKLLYGISAEIKAVLQLDAG
jgi:hypothetical protein